MKLLKNLLKSPMFVIGTSLLVLTLLTALIGPAVYKASTGIDIMNTSNIARAVDPDGTSRDPYDPPTANYVFGLDHDGRDYVALLIMGLRSSLWVGLLAGLIATTLGTLIGIYGGFMGGVVDDVLSVLTNLFIVIPQFVILVLISSSMAEGARSLTLIAVIIGLTSWTWSARSVRAQSAALKSKDHISLAKLNGDKTLRVLLIHILPYLFSYVFMVFIMTIASGILSESAISMIGLGPNDTISLGVILNHAQTRGALSDGIWWAFLPATVIITLVVFSLYLINTSMEGVFNPRLRK